jgi:hypothetical protein
MRLSEIKSFVFKNNLEKKCNRSLNYYQINTPKNTFYSGLEIDIFSKKGSNLSYLNYYQHLSKKYDDNNSFIDYLGSKCDKWIQNDPTLNKREALAYLLKIFVINPVDGKVKELNVKNKIKEIFKDYQITEPTPQQDVEECWDLKVSNGNINFYLQVKPNSFFKALNTTSKQSLIKIDKAAKKHKKAIFLTNENNGEVNVYIRDIKQKDKCRFIKLKDFQVGKLNQDSINSLSEKTFLNIISKIPIDKNNFRRKKFNI